MNSACAETRRLHTPAALGKASDRVFSAGVYDFLPHLPCVCECERNRGDGEFGAAEK